MNSSTDRLTERFLLTPKEHLAGFCFASDRSYFSKPVRVHIVRTDDLGLVYVTDPSRGQTYPVNAKHLVCESALTRRQALSARR